LASEPKSLPVRGPQPSKEARRLAQLAEEPAFFEAQRWFARERSWIVETHLQLCRVAAPTFFEGERAEWFRTQLERLGWRARLDRAGNVLADFGSQTAPSLVVSAHLDTVFAPTRPEDIYLAPDGRLVGPGVSDNGAGLSALLALARLLSETPDLQRVAESVLLAANVGEEGEGNLSGMRYLCLHGLSSQNIRPEDVKAFLVLDGPSTDHITAQALASRRFEVSFTGPGGHSWNDYGTPNPVHALGDLISHFASQAEARLAAERRTRSSYNFGIVEGGTSVNAIPASARAKLDLRSESAPMLEELSSILSTTVERSLENERRGSRSGRLTAKIKELGARPGGRLSDESALLGAVQTVDHYLGIRSRVDCASTDANVPLSMGLPAISIGAGGQGGGAHTPGEWYHPDGRETGLRRILLLLTLLAEG
jgi:tripeptide aminopeptidase